MALLILFGFVAGVGTALSPCVLPVLPVALAAGATGGRRRPAGIVVGLALSFTFATVALVYLLDALGLSDGLLRTLAIIALLTFGVMLLVPPLAARVEVAIGRVVGSGLGGPRAGGDGFGSGLVVGASLGLGLRAVRRAGARGRDHGLGVAAVDRRAARGRAGVRHRLGDWRSTC